MRDRPPPPIVRRTKHALMPASPYDAQELMAYPLGAEFDLVARTKRSHPQNGTYWKALTRAVEATGRWERREALHDALKVKLGYVKPIFDMDGNVTGMIPDSTKFEEMSHREFGEYMDKAMAALSEALGYDALGWMTDDLSP